MTEQIKMPKQIETLSLIVTHGRRITIKDKETYELIGCNFIVDDFNIKLNKNQRWYVNKKLSKYKNKIHNAINILKKDKNSRQSIITFDADRKHFPECFISIQFLIRENNLYTIVNTRSLDVINKLKQDISIAHRLSETVEKEIGVKLKFIRFFVGSCHFYTK